VERDLRDLPQEVRGWFESDVLGRWREADLRGDAAGAATLLAAARTAGGALRKFSGETLLADAAEAIDGARGEGPERPQNLAPPRFDEFALLPRRRGRQNCTAASRSDAGDPFYEAASAAGTETDMSPVSDCSTNVTVRSCEFVPV
jgi:hypothetical protein